MLRIYALLTTQGTAASETMLCEDDLRVLDAVLMVGEVAPDDLAPERTFEDVTDNDEAACRWCGRDRNENTGAIPLEDSDEIP